MRYWLGLGSNIGCRAVNIAEAILRLTRCGVRLLRLSSAYQTAPVGVVDQPPFVNMVAAVQAPAQPLEMLKMCLGIERQMGRVRRQRWGPRVIDIDLLLADGPPVDVEGLQIPHPRILERQFVLVPLAEVWPDAPLPDGRTAAEAADPRHPDVVRLGPLAAVVRGELAASAGQLRPPAGGTL